MLRSLELSMIRYSWLFFSDFEIVPFSTDIGVKKHPIF